MNSSGNSPRPATSRTPRRSLFASVVVGAVTAAAALGALGCNDKLPYKPGESRTFAGGIVAEAQILNEGYVAYTRYCFACHGENGDGKGPASYGLRPSPRNFTLGIFKFARMRSSDELPHDDDLVRIVKGGLHGTAMLPWDIQEDELRKVLQYIKTFAPKKWEKKKKNGEPVKTIAEDDWPADPWASKDAAAIERGRELYHFKAECVNCHPAYGGKEELYKLSVAANKREPEVFKPLTGYRDDFYGSVAKDSAEYGGRILPPDFMFNRVRSVRAGHELEDLFRALSYGIYPVMPAWKDALLDSDIWAIAHYVKSLMAMRDTKDGAELRASFASQSSFEVPKAEPAKAAEPQAAEPAKDGDKKDEPAKDAPAKDAPAKDAPAKDAPAKDAPAKDAPAKDAPAH